MQESGLIEIIPLICTSANYGQYPVLFHPEFPQGAPLGAVVMVDGLMAATSFVYQYGGQHFSSSGLTLHGMLK